MNSHRYLIKTISDLSIDLMMFSSANSGYLWNFFIKISKRKFLSLACFRTLLYTHTNQAMFKTLLTMRFQCPSSQAIVDVIVIKSHSSEKKRNATGRKIWKEKKRQRNERMPQKRYMYIYTYIRNSKEQCDMFGKVIFLFFPRILRRWKPAVDMDVLYIN